MFSLDQYKALRERAVVVIRDDLGRLSVRGKDRRTYLHGLLTNDIEGLAAGAGCYAALLTPQGRMITDMHVYELGDGVVVTLPRALAATIHERLERFIFSEDVQVEDVSEVTAQVGVYGPASAEIVRSLDLTPAPLVLSGDDFGATGFELIVPAGQLDDLSVALEADGAVRLSADTAEVIRVEAGIPRFLVDMTDETIPLEAGVQDRMISMTKGCYPGQEVIVRVLHRGGGRVAKRLVKIALPEGADVPARGTTLRAGDREVGAVTSAVHSWALGRPVVLGFVHRDFTAPGSVVEAVADNGKRAPGEVLAPTR